MCDTVISCEGKQAGIRIAQDKQSMTGITERALFLSHVTSSSTTF
jgi:hypothetical protein